MSDYYIAVDFGGTQLSAILFDGEMNPLIRYTGSGANINGRSEVDVVCNITQCVDALFAERKIDRIRGVYGWMMHSQEVFRKEIEKHTVCNGLEILSEGVMGAFACGIVSNAITVLAGTGSGAFYLSHGKTFDWVGGWGALLGDDGSGFSVGRAYLRALIANEEQRIKDPAIEKICQKYQALSMREVMERIYTSVSPAAQIASLAKMVCREDEMGDPRAHALLLQAGAWLGNQVARLFMRNGLPPSTPMCLMGGLLIASRTMQTALSHYLTLKQLKSPLLHPVLIPVEGAIAYAYYKKHGSLSSSEFHSLIQRLHNIN